MPISQIVLLFFLIASVVGAAFAIVLRSRRRIRALQDQLDQVKQAAADDRDAMAHALNLVATELASPIREALIKARREGASETEACLLRLVDQIEIAMELVETCLSRPIHSAVLLDFSRVLMAVADRMEHRREVELEIPGRPLAIHAPQEPLIKALERVLAHAAKASSHPALRIVLKQDGARACVAIWTAEDVMRATSSRGLAVPRSKHASLEIAAADQFLKSIGAELKSGRTASDPSFYIWFPVVEHDQDFSGPWRIPGAVAEVIH